MTIWHDAPTLEALNAARTHTLSGHLDIVFTEIGPDFLCASMPVDERTWQPMGLLHGGASVALAETVGSVGGALCVDRSRYTCVGMEINANHVRSERTGRVQATARPAHLGARTHVWTIEIVNPAGKLVCLSRLTLAVINLR